MWDNQHYKGEQKDVVQRMPPILRLGFLVGNVMKYNTRSGQKDTEPWSKDFKKGRHYSIMLEELLEQRPALKAILERPDQWLNEATETLELPQGEEKVYESRLQVQYTDPNAVRLDTSDTTQEADDAPIIDIAYASEVAELALKMSGKAEEAPDPGPYHYLLPKGVQAFIGDEYWLVKGWLSLKASCTVNDGYFRRKLPVVLPIQPRTVPPECVVGPDHFLLPQGEPHREGDEAWVVKTTPDAVHYTWVPSKGYGDSIHGLYRRKLPH